MRCFKCGTNIADQADKCPNCGQNFRQVKKDFSKNLYAKIKELSTTQNNQKLPLNINIGDSVSEQYTIQEYIGEYLIFYSFIGVDNFNKQKVQVDFVKPTIFQNENEQARFINSLREEKFRQHENLALIYDYGKVNNHYYIISEYLDGVTLDKILTMKQKSNENFSIDEVEPIIAQITDALSEIHEDSLNGYLTPDNIIIMSDVLKIRNYFWFRCFRSEVVLKYFTSESNSFYYLAPELRGGSQKLTNATDIYSIGVLLSSLLTGKIYKGVPFNLTEYNKILPPNIDSLFFKLINKNSNKRYQNIEEFLFDFDNLFKDEDEIQLSGEKTRVVNANEVIPIDDDDENFDFEDEMETAMHQAKKDAKKEEVVSIEKDEIVYEDEVETSMHENKNKQNKKNKNNKQQFNSEKKPEIKTIKQEIQSKPEIKEKILPIQEEKVIKSEEKIVAKPEIAKETLIKEQENPEKDNPFFKPEQFSEEQQNYQKQQLAGQPVLQTVVQQAIPEQIQYQQPQSMYQQMPYPPYQQPNNQKNLFIIMGFIILSVALATSIIIIILKDNKQEINPYILSKLEADKGLESIQKKAGELDLQKQELEKQKKELEELKKQLTAVKDNNSMEISEEDVKKIEDMKKQEQIKIAEMEKKQKEFDKQQEDLEKQKKIEEQKKLEAEAKIKEKNLQKELEKEEIKQKEEEKKKAAEVLKQKEIAKKEEVKVTTNIKKETTSSKVETVKTEDKKEVSKSTKDNDYSDEADKLLAMATKETSSKDVKTTEKDTSKDTAVISEVKKDGNCPQDMVKIKEGGFAYGSSATDPLRGNEPLLQQISLSMYCIDRIESSVSVSFSQAEASCKKQGKRLCTTQEWEKACKGPASNRFPYGSEFDASKCNTADENGTKRTAAKSGEFKKCRSPYGLFDMSGNYSEWTIDGTDNNQPLKGGDFSSEDYDARCASVKKRAKTYKDAGSGFRCCKNPE